LLKEARNCALFFIPHTIGFLSRYLLLDLDPRDIRGHAFGFIRAWMNFHPTTLKTE